METKKEEWYEYIGEVSDEQLKETAIELHNSIYNRRCYRIRDLMEHESILDELDYRGYEIKERSILEFE